MVTSFDSFLMAPFVFLGAMKGTEQMWRNLLPHSFSGSMEQTECFWRQNDVIWQLVKLHFCQITSSWRQKRAACSMELKNKWGQTVL